MITRRRVACAGGASLLGAHRLSHGQSTAPPRRVGLLLLGSEVESAPRLAALAQGMRELGWLEGTNVEFRPAFADGDANRLATLAGELVTQKVEVIVVGGSQGVRAAQRASRAIPIVMTNVGDPVADEFVASLARPGGNITGTSNQAPEVLAKVIEILHEVAPRARRIAVLLNEDNPSHPRQWAAAQRACAALNLVPLRVVASAPAQLGAAVDQIARLKAQAVAVTGDALFAAERVRLLELLRATQLPVAYGNRDLAFAGGLLSYAANNVAAYRYAAKFVDKILKGANPADLPVEQPTRFELVVNLKTAKSLGLKIPHTVLLRADEVIE